MEIITGRERRRRWSIAGKLRIVAEPREPGARLTEVAARRGGIDPGLLFSWRRQVCDGSPSLPPPATFVPVRLAAEPEEVAEPARGNGLGAKSSDAGVVAITPANGCQLRIDQHVDV